MAEVSPAMIEQIKRQRVAKEHSVALIEGGVVGDDPMPGYFVIICRCGFSTRSYWGHDHAQEIAERHIFTMLHEVQITPGGANVRPRR